MNELSLVFVSRSEEDSMRGKEMSEAAAAADQMEPATKAKAGASIAAFYASECQAVNTSTSISRPSFSLLLSYLLLTHRQRTAGRAGRTTPNTRPFKSVSFFLLLEPEKSVYTQQSSRNTHVVHTFSTPIISHIPFSLLPLVT